MSTFGEQNLNIKMSVQVLVNPITEDFSLKPLFSFSLLQGDWEATVQRLFEPILLSIEWHSSGLQVYNFQIGKQSIGILHP